MSIVDMTPGRVRAVVAALRTEVTDMRTDFTQLTDAERKSQDAAMLLGVRRPLTEFLDETAKLATVVETYHDLMVNADRYHPTDLAQRRAAFELLLGGLAAGLGDGVGAAGTAAEMIAYGNALRAEAQTGAETVFGWMESTGSEGYSRDEFAALADDPSVPDHVRLAIEAIITEPVMMGNLARAGWIAGSSDGVTTESIGLLVATQEASRGLGDRANFDALDSANNGEFDDRISWDDLHHILDDDDAHPEVRALAELFEDNPLVFKMLDPGTEASRAGDFSLAAFDFDGRISFGDVVATAVNTQAFEGRSADARDFVMGLPSTNDHRDGSGNYLPIQWFSDSGVRNLAQSALLATPLLSEQVGVVERLPESPGGIRNLAITEYYRRIGGELNEILNPDGAGGVLPLDAQGSTGTSWFMQGTFASAGIRPVLVDNAGYGPFTAGWAARQEMADGNQLLFGSLASPAAAFIEAFPPGTEPTETDIARFFNGERADGTPLFADGDRQMRDSFALLLEAATDPHPVTRQQTTFQSSLLLGVHEQALVDPFVDRAIDQGREDGYRWLGDIGNPSDSIATGQIDPALGEYQFDADKPLPSRRSHPDHVIGQDLTTTLNPTGVTTVDIGGVTYDLTGSGDGDIDLEGLAGWAEVPDHWEVDAHEIDPAQWHDEHGQVPAGPGDDPKLETVPGSSTGVPLPGNDDLPGAAVTDWKDYEDRMWTITNSFQQTHTLPSMNETLPGLGFDEADLSFLPEPG